MHSAADHATQPCRNDTGRILRSQTVVEENVGSRASGIGASLATATVTAGKIPVMTTRRRGKNGAAVRYKGERELVAARVRPTIVDRIDDARDEVGGRSRNDWIAAAILRALKATPEEMAESLRELDEIEHSQPTGQLAFSEDEVEVLDRTA